MIVDGDVVIALSHSGETAELIALLPGIRRKQVDLIALVGDRRSTVAREADVVLHVDIDTEACPLGLAPTASTTVALAIGDALAMALLEERGFAAEDFAAVHPRGRLGKGLLRVSHVMHTGDELPRVTLTAGIGEIVDEMSGKAFGMTVVVAADGRVVGIITDGDLRRLLQRGISLQEITASEFMSARPAQITIDALATEALRLMEERKITSLLVLDADVMLLGVVHLHDLWRTEMI